MLMCGSELQKEPPFSHGHSSRAAYGRGNEVTPHHPLSDASAKAPQPRDLRHVPVSLRWNSQYEAVVGVHKLDAFFKSQAHLVETKGKEVNREMGEQAVEIKQDLLNPKHSV